MVYFCRHVVLEEQNAACLPLEEKAASVATGCHKTLYFICKLLSTSMCCFANTSRVGPHCH